MDWPGGGRFGTLECAPLKVFQILSVPLPVLGQPYRAKLWLKMGPLLMDGEIGVPRISRSFGRIPSLKKKPISMFLNSPQLIEGSIFELLSTVNIVNRVVTIVKGRNLWRRDFYPILSQ
jgi:hypothetical protein